MFSKSFTDAVETVLSHEGGFVDDPKDAGGATNWGVSLRYLIAVGDLNGDGLPDYDVDHDGDVDSDDVRKLSRDQAIQIYLTQWWERYGYEQLAPTIAGKVLDLAINMGAPQAHKLLQRACRSCGERITDDGQLGPLTRSAIARNDQWALLAAFRSEAAGFYRLLVATKPRCERYLEGWLRRAYA